MYSCTYFLWPFVEKTKLSFCASFVNLGEAEVFLKTFRGLFSLHILLKCLSGRKWAKKVVQFWKCFWINSCLLLAFTTGSQISQKWKKMVKSRQLFWTEIRDNILICESTSELLTISNLDPTFTWSLESVKLFHFIVHSPGQIAEIFTLSPTVCLLQILC